MRIQRHTWWTVGIGAAGVLFAAALGIVTFLRAMKTPLYRSPQEVPSIQQPAPTREWAAAAALAQQRARAAVVEQNLPGLSIAVGAGNRLVWAEGFGWADIEKRVPVTPRTRFRIGHVSKALTSAAAGLLLEEDRLHLHDEIQKYVPAFPAKPWPITLRQLMGHLSGVRHYSDQDPLPTTHCERASDALGTFANDPLRFEPETQYGYSAYGWVLVSAAVEAAAGEPFFAFMRRRIFAPLGMADTTSDAPTGSDPAVATPYDRLDHGFTPEPARVADYSCRMGAGGFVSTPSDLVRFGLAMGHGTLLKPETVTMLQTPQELRSGERTSYGLGWMLDRMELADGSVRMAGHPSRSLVGGATSFWTLPDRGIVVAVTVNVSFADWGSELAKTIAGIFADTGRPPARR